MSLRWRILGSIVLVVVLSVLASIAVGYYSTQLRLDAFVDRLGNLSIDYGERRLTVAGRTVELTAREYAVLFELSVNSGRVMTHEQLLLRVWGSRETGDSSLVRTIVNRLRRKLDDDAKNPSFIITMPGVGYRMARSIDSGVGRPTA